ncbi:hypothetical protein [Winogradskyella sp.]|uniref:hypothetical protein n=1 Tax=Winogradskyella sp. TaxID=1883156 RepID=UPI003BA9DD11
MKLKPLYIVVGFVSLCLVNCAMENRSVKSESSNSIVDTAEEVEEVVNIETESTVNAQLINQKLQDFYDLVALQNEHPEFMEEVSQQLKNFTNDSISNFKTSDFTVIKNVQQIGKTMIINDSIQRIKLSYDKVINNSKRRDTIYAIITKKIITIDNETLMSHKVQFSKD